MSTDRTRRDLEQPRSDTVGMKPVIATQLDKLFTNLEGFLTYCTVFGVVRATRDAVLR